MNGDLSTITTYQAGIAQATAHRLLQKLCDQILKPYGITKMQWLIIGSILDAGPKGIRLSDMASSLGTTLPYMTTSINLLESMEIVHREGNANDSRSKLVVLAESFRVRCDEIEHTLRQGLRDTIYAEIDPAEFRMYMKVLYQLKDAAGDPR